MSRYRFRARPLLARLCVVLAATACGNPSPSDATITQKQALDAAWNALDPHTSSHDRANWQAVRVAQVQGRAVSERFDFEPAPGCPGPDPALNAPIGAASTYWHVQFQSLPATSLPEATEFYSPTAPPLVPEPFVGYAEILVDASTGSVVARRISCAIY